MAYLLCVPGHEKTCCSMITSRQAAAFEIVCKSAAAASAGSSGVFPFTML